MSTEALRPYRIVVTGEREDLETRFPGRHGKSGRPLEWHSLPLLAFEPLPIETALLRELREEPVDWIIFTSSRAVKFFSAHLKSHGVVLPRQTQIACVGEQTAQIAREAGLESDFFPSEPGSEKFLEEFEARLAVPTAKPSLFIPMAEGGRATIRERLADLGCRVRWVPLYRTVPKHDLVAPAALAQSDLVVFTSPSCVEIFLKHFTIPAGAKIAAIGRFTAAALDRLGVKDWSLLPEGSLRRAEELLP